MQTTWTDFFYGNRPPLFPPLSPHNWAEWSANVVQLLQLFDNVGGILLREIKEEDPVYSRPVDIELYFLLLKLVREDVRPIAVQVRNENGIMGSRLYEAFKKQFEGKDRSDHDDVWKAVIQGRKGMVHQSKRAKQLAERAEDAAKKSATLERKKKRKAGEDPTKDRNEEIEDAKVSMPSEAATNIVVEEHEATLDAGETKEEADEAKQADEEHQDKRGTKSKGLSFGVGYPTLTPETWPTWNSKLKEEVSRNKIHLNILTGAVKEGHRDYDPAFDKALYTYVKKSMRLFFKYLTKEATSLESAKKGSQLYAILEDEVRSLKGKEIMTSISLVQQPAEIVTQVFNNYKKLYLKAQEYDLPISEEDLDSFVEAVDGNFSKRVRPLILKSVGCKNLRQYCASVLCSQK